MSVLFAPSRLVFVLCCCCCVAYTSGVKLASGSADHSVRIWNLDNGECVRTLQGHSDWVTGLSARSESIVLSAASDGQLKLWDWTKEGEEDGEACLVTLSGQLRRDEHTKLLMERKFLNRSSDGSFELFHIDTGRLVQFLGHSSFVSSIELLGDDTLASGSKDHTVKTWSMSDGECLRTLTGHTGWVTGLAALDGWLASGSRDKTVRVWDLASGECERVLSGHTSDVSVLKWLSGQTTTTRRLVSGSFDHTVRVWNVETGECERVLVGHTNYVLSLEVLTFDKATPASLLLN